MQHYQLLFIATQGNEGCVVLDTTTMVASGSLQGLALLELSEGHPSLPRGLVSNSTLPTILLASHSLTPINGGSRHRSTYYN
jgi:hypothetical protein